MHTVPVSFVFRVGMLEACPNCPGMYFLWQLSSQSAGNGKVVYLVFGCEENR